MRAKTIMAGRLESFWPFLLATLGILIAVTGCHRATVADGTGDTVVAMRRLTLAYSQYAAQNRGMGPANQAALVKFIMQHDRISQDAAEAFFVSPRDKQPYIVRWGRRPLGAAILGPDPPTPEILVVEATALGGQRFVADGQGTVQQIAEAEAAQLVSQQIALGK